MKPSKINILVFACLLLAVAAHAAPLPCVKPGTERWPVKITVPDNPKHKNMTLDDALKIDRLSEVRRNDPRYQNKRITDPPVKEDTMVTLSGYLYLVAFESDDCDFHIQLTTKPVTRTPTKADNSMIVEVPSGEYAKTVVLQVSRADKFVAERLSCVLRLTRQKGCR